MLAVINGAKLAAPVEFPDWSEGVAFGLLDWLGSHSVYLGTVMRVRRGMALVSDKGIEGESRLKMSGWLLAAGLETG